MTDETIIGFLRHRTDDAGKFDELIGTSGFLHFEMMSDSHLWVGIDHLTEPNRRVAVNIFVKGRKLIVRVEDDSTTA
jgi:hypothetical protein